MTLLHCPLCLGLAVLSVLRAASHLLLVGLRFAPVPVAQPRPAARLMPL